MPSMAAANVLGALPADLETVAVRAGGRIVIGVAPDEVVAASGAAALDRLETLPPGWWAGFVSYDLGRAVEHVTTRRPPAPDAPPDIVLARFTTRVVLDPSTGSAEIIGDGASRPLLEAAVRRRAQPDPPGAAIMEWVSSLGRDEFEAGVRHILELIRAGECYQVNLTRRLTCPTALDPVALFAALERHNPSPYAALLRLAQSSVVSASPECFLRWRGREVETRPVKGTGADPGTLRASAKDRAENVMIVDLARNDLGRVCAPGSIHVPALCAVEAHPGLHHLVSTVRGCRREDAGVGALMRATLPPASVTGAPKPRVLQIIEDLEPVRRGVYCGAVGWIDTEHDAGELAVAIRTFTMTNAATHLGVGAGIVADSRPDAEWAETELKAARLLATAARRGVRPTALVS